MIDDTSKTEILEAINEFSTKIDGRLDSIDGRLDKVDGRLDKVDGRLGKLEQDVGILKADVGYLKSQMVTKDDLERSLGKFKGELTLTLRNEDVKLRELISILQEKQVLTLAEAQHICAMAPFPQLDV